MLVPGAGRGSLRQREASSPYLTSFPGLRTCLVLGAGT